MHIFKKISNRNQLFISSLILISIPLICVSIYFSNKSINDINSKYQQSLSEITNQISVNVNTLIKEADRLSYLHLINDNIYQALNRDFNTNSLEFAVTSQMMRENIANAINLNPNIINVIFISKYDMIYDYNFTSNKELEDILKKIDAWKKIASENKNYTYVGPLQYSKYSNSIYKNIIPMVKILKDINNNDNIGILYLGINFNSIYNLFKNSKIENSSLLFFDQDNTLFFSNDNINKKILSNKDFSNLVKNTDSDNTNLFSQINYDNKNYTINSVCNITTNWKIVNILDNKTITQAYKSNIYTFILIFILIALFDFILAYIFSFTLSSSIRNLCKQLDEFEICSNKPLNIDTKFTSMELQKLINSYNKLNQRLIDSIKTNYIIKLNEKQLKLQMLRSQINPHFLYNTLNSISSLANIYNVPEIKSITTALSDLLRYNLKGKSVVTLKEEIEQIKRYITIQQIRFPNKFIFECNIPENFFNISIPIFILQPLIENCIIHGFDEKTINCYILINIYTDNQFTHILVSDNGCGIQEHKLQELNKLLMDNKSTQNNKSIGITNVNQRIKTYYGNKYGLSIESYIGEGTIIDIIIPK